MKVFKTYPQHLAKHIKFFYSVHASASENINSIHRRLPDGTLDIVFNLSSPILISRDEVNFSEMPQVALTGLYQDRSFLQYKGNVNLIGAVFQPGSAHLFVNDALQHYQACTTKASSVFGNNVYFLLEQLKNLSNEKEKHNLLEGFLLNCLKNKSNDYNTTKISGVIKHIHSLEGNIEMSTLHKNHFMSERNFRRKFTECVGMSPKKYSTIIKVKNFSKRYQSVKSTYTSIVNDLGYSDQSHFNKDFLKIVGTSPTIYFSQLNKMGEEFIHLI